ncbi:YybH family protein [Nocardia bovistercoris]|uniref:Nuclear transport factor 2 family protein n=1 Tax=Nocardia bovistercoris TaxID=2785916 RepID=A0A931ID07_9NOCA|nr:nuclear transport factor 2 family protein [Nocardia bovistercoris]MBH0779412.1 nuclear transport factor 2 family protein [Nocardia bovistercoris]
MEQNVIDTVSRMTEALQRGDIDAVLSHYVADAVVAFEPGASVRGEQHLREGFAAFAALDPRFRYDHGHEVMISGDTAVHIAPWTMTGTAPDGTPVAQSGLSVATLRRQADDSWKIALDNPFGARLIP